MAAETQICNALVGQHMSVVRAVDFMAGGAAFDPGGLVFVEERAALVGMATDALFILEPAQTRPRGWLVLIMAGCAFQDSLLKPMALVQGKLSSNVLMAGQTDLTRSHLIAGILHQFGVTIGAVHTRFAVGTGVEAAARLGVTLETFIGLGVRFICFLEGKDRPGPSSLFQMVRRVTVTVGTQGLHLDSRLRPLIRLDLGVADELEIRADILMTFGTDAEFLLLFLRRRLGRDQQASDHHEQSKDAEPLDGGFERLVFG